MGLKIYDTLRQDKFDFVSKEPGKVRMYVCGPTVYGLLHVGNFRGPIFFNLVRNWLEVSGYQVQYVYNYTDVDDKIINRAKEEGVSSSEISEKYIREFEKDFASLKLRRHDLNPRVTEYMEPIRKIVGELISRGKAYVKDGEVLYSVRSFDGYGKLSHRKIDDLQSGARVEVDEKKRDPLDFALWKPAKPGEPTWPSEWSEGRPGWHIECSAMCQAILGNTLDIHGGGMDLIFPHHENEIAQSEGATGQSFVNYWMHNNMLTFGDRKMSKSLGNIVSCREFVEKYNGEIMKFMMLQGHYRSLLDFSDKQIGNAISGLARIYSALSLASEVLKSDVVALKPSLSFAKALGETEKAWVEALNDDFNTPEAFAAIFNLVRNLNNSYRYGQKVTGEIKANAQAFVDWIVGKGQLMSLFQEPAAEFLQTVDDMLLEQMGLERSRVDALVLARTEARANKDFARSDELRAELTKLGISVQDLVSGSRWEVQK